MDRTHWFRGLTEHERTGERYWLYDCAIEIFDCDRKDKKFNWRLCDYPIFNDTLGEFTTLRDINNKNIYEDDVVCLDNKIGVVIWNKETLQWCVKFTNDTIPLYKLKDKIMVLGNIFTNKEFKLSTLKENDDLYEQPERKAEYVGDE